MLAITLRNCIFRNCNKAYRICSLATDMSTNLEISNELKVDVDVLSNNKRPSIEKEQENIIKKQKVEEPLKVRKKNYALLMGYLGRDYYGMQRNHGMKTIEGDLLTALRKNDLITDENVENMRTMYFQRAARTDKGVSASRQVVSIKLPDHVNKTDINEFLPNEIRVFGLKRVTKGFNSKNQCSARTYRYIIPTFAFAPEDPNSLPTLEEYDPEKRLEELSVIDGKPYNEFRLSPELLEKLNSFLKKYEGTHNFHNFTSRVRPLDPRAKRHIITFRCAETFITENTEFAALEIKGQSFLLHQIRKMVAVTVGAIRNIAKENILEEAFKHTKFDIPIAPSLGLSLHYVHYDYYNKRYGTDGIHEPLDWKECEEEIQNFHKEYIVKHIVDTEIAEKTTLRWLSTLPEYSFSAVDEEPICTS